MTIRVSLWVFWVNQLIWLTAWFVLFVHFEVTTPSLFFRFVEKYQIKWKWLFKSSVSDSINEHKSQSFVDDGSISLIRDFIFQNIITVVYLTEDGTTKGSAILSFKNYSHKQYKKTLNRIIRQHATAGGGNEPQLSFSYKIYFYAFKLSIQITCNQHLTARELIHLQNTRCCH